MLKTLMLPRERILAGREAGRSIREELNLNELDFDNTESQICILVSSKTWSINTSFFIGCFAESVRRLGRTLFEQKYRFYCDDDCISKMIDNNIDRCEKLVNYEKQIGAW